MHSGFSIRIRAYGKTSRVDGEGTTQAEGMALESGSTGAPPLRSLKFRPLKMLLCILGQIRV